MKGIRTAIVGIALLSIPWGVQVGAAAQDAASYYKGKTIEFVVPNKPGGGYDTYSRLMAPYLEKYTGTTVVVKNKPGGGGVVGMGLVYRAEPDGRTIGIANMTGSIPAQIGGAEGMNLDLRKFVWLARVCDEPQVFVVGAQSKYKTWDDILKTKNTVKLSCTGTTGSSYLDLLVLKMVFDLKTFDIITGFKGTSDADLSIIRGEVDGGASSLGTKIRKIQAGDLKPLLVMYDEKAPELPNTPLIFDYPMSPDGKAIAEAYISMMSVARSLMTTPGVSADRVAFLRDAFHKVLTDPDLLAKAKKMKRPIAWMSGEKVQAKVDKSITGAPQVFVSELKAVIK